MERVTKADMARRLGVTPSAISKAVTAGRLTVDADGLIDPVAGAAQWAVNRQRRRRRSRDAPEVEGGAAPPAAAGGEGSDYWTHKARREKAEATLAELRLAEQAGTLVLREAINRTLFLAARVMRDQMLAIAPRLAASLGPVTDPKLIELRIADEVRVALRAFAQQLRTGGLPDPFPAPPAPCTEGDSHDC